MKGTTSAARNSPWSGLSAGLSKVPSGGGGSAIVEFRAVKTGTLVRVDHAIFRAFNKGALGMITVTGTDDPRVYAQNKGLGMTAH